MDALQQLTCANCGAALRVEVMRGAVVTCDHCGTTFRVPETLVPEPEMGDLLLGADFRDPAVPGWPLFDKDKLEFKPGPPPELWRRHEASDLIHPVLRTPGPLDDFDVAVTMRFIEGKHEYVSAGLEVRSGDDGDYIMRISAQGTYRLGWHNKLEWGGNLVSWTTHPALRTKMGEPNRLRMLLHGDLIRIYLNGVLAASLHDARFRSGFVRLVVSPSKESGIVAAFSDLQLREVKAH